MGSVNNMKHAACTVETIAKLLKAFCGTDFTKRQTNICAFILSLEIQSKKERVFIPYLKDFKQAGVSPSKITGELEELESMNVILWNRQDMIFSINTQVDQWKVKKFTMFNFQRCNELLELNTQPSQL